MINDIEIRQLIKFAGTGPAIASLTVRFGSLVVRNIRLMESAGKRWIAFPSKKMGNGNWFHLVSLCSHECKQQLETLASQAYDRALQEEDLPELIPAF